MNTAIGALIGLTYMMARDGEMPRSFTRLNLHGVPWIPLGIAALLPFLVAAFSADLQSLAGLYAIGVVGAITVNLGSCVFNRQLTLNWHERLVMALTFLVLFSVELTIAKTKRDALFFACCVVGVGLGLRAWSQKRAGLRTVTVPEHLVPSMAPDLVPNFKINLSPGYQSWNRSRPPRNCLSSSLSALR